MIGWFLLKFYSLDVRYCPSKNVRRSSLGSRATSAFVIGRYGIVQVFQISAIAGMQDNFLWLKLLYLY